MTRPACRSSTGAVCRMALAWDLSGCPDPRVAIPRVAILTDHEELVRLSQPATCDPPDRHLRSRQITTHSTLGRGRWRDLDESSLSRHAAEREPSAISLDDHRIRASSPPNVPPVQVCRSRAHAWRFRGTAMHRPPRTARHARPPARSSPPTQPHARSIAAPWKPRAQPHPRTWTTATPPVDDQQLSVDDQALSVGRAWNTADRPKPPHVAMGRWYRPQHLVVLGLTPTLAKRIVRRVA